jgi:Lrp/AsnC family leucine-responsive transcriptional regulator
MLASFGYSRISFGSITSFGLFERRRPSLARRARARHDPRPMDLDPIDRKLVALLQQDGRATNNELAREVGLAVSSANERVRKLVDRGVLTGFHAHASAEALDLDLLALVFVGWSAPATERPFLERVVAEGCVLECHHVTGTWNYALKVRVKNPRMLEAFLAEVVKAVPGVERTETIIVLSSAKESWALPVGPPDWAPPRR